MDDVKPPSPPLSLTIRFTTALPDLPLPIAAPADTTVVALKRLVRARLPADASARHIRLIHAGKVLGDAAALSTLLPPASRKGKNPRDRAVHVYLHASIGDVLPASALAAEAAQAAALEARPAAAAPPSHSPASDGHDGAPAPRAPRGFDRLRTAGLSAAEVGSLRAQFRALTARNYTPDDMPDAAGMRALEDAWLDESSAEGGLPGSGAAATANTSSVSAAAAAGYHDMLLGNVLGFFWPLGALVWLLREEGVWSARRQMAVFTGVLVNVAFSVLRITS